MRDVIDLYSQAITDREGSVHLPSIRMLNPPAHLWAGVQLYARVMRRNISEMQVAAAEAAKRKRR